MRFSPLLLTCLALALLLGSSCKPSPPDGTGIPEEVLRHNVLGTAYLGQQKWGEAEAEFRLALETRPEDPLLLTNVAVALVQQGRIDEAETFLQTAITHDPEHVQAHYNLGLIQKNRGDFEAAVGHFESVTRNDPDDLLTQYNLGIVLSRTGRNDEAEKSFRAALDRDPGHVSTLYALGRFLLQRGDPEGERLIALSQEIRARSGLDEAVGTQYGEQGPHAMGNDYPGGALDAPAPIAVDFEASTTLETQGPVPPVAAIRHGDAAGPAVLVAHGTNLEIVTSDGVVGVAPAPGAVLEIAGGDADNDGRVDLAALVRTGSGMSLAILKANEDGSWSWRDDETLTSASSSSAPETSTNVSMTWVDGDHDGDLDLFWCWSGGGGTDCRLGTNDGTSRFEVEPSTDHGFGLGEAGDGPVVVSLSDVDNDRDIDLVVLDPGGVHVLSNQRDGSFADVSDAMGLGGAEAGSRSMELVDLDKDGWMDLLVGGPDGTRWLANRAGRFDAPRGIAGAADATDRAMITDVDNDGFLDIVVGTLSGARLLRNRGAGQWAEAKPLTAAGKAAIPLASWDADRDGDLDLLMHDPALGTVLLTNQGGNGNRWIELDTRGIGDNKFGIGAKVEILAGGLRQKFELTSTLPIHAGLGDRKSVESARYLWPSGVLQDEVNLTVGGAVEITQLDRKGTSCPLLYAWRDGRWRFETDFLGGCAIGYQHAPGVFSTPDTDEYVRIEGGLEPDDDGMVRIRLNNQLEEVIWFDQAELLAVDHPRGTEVYPNERLMPGPPWPEFSLFASDDLRPVRSATGVEDGRDLTGLLHERDRRYVDNFELLPFKGYATPHTVEVDLGALPADRRIVLLLDGWIDYADSTSNVAAHQAGVVLTPPRLHVADGRGRWIETDHVMGFPAGLPKTMAVDLDGLFPSDDLRLRIETNMRIYWDRARVMVGGEHTDLRVRRISAASADLRRGGFPSESSADGRKPFGYDASNVAPHGPWKAHVGAYTAFGEVSERLSSIDDRFVTTRNGDEIEIAFRAPASPPDGWTRTWLLFADGFGKDMDPNSAASSEVGPIPFHGMPTYPYPEDIAPPVQTADGSEPASRRVLPSPRGLPGARPQVFVGDAED